MTTMTRGIGRVTLVATAVVVLGCGSDVIPSPLASTLPTESTPSSQSPTSLAKPSTAVGSTSLPSQSALPTPGASPSSGLARLSPDKVHVVDMGQYFHEREIAANGPIVYYTALDRHTVRSVDLGSGDITTLWDSGQADPGLVAIEGDYLFWNEWHGEHGKVLYRRNLITREQVEVDRWTEASRHCVTDNPSILTVSGGRIAYSKGTPTDGNPLASTIVVRDAETLEELWDIATEMHVYALGFASDAVVYGEGHVGGNPYCLGGPERMMLARAGATPVDLAVEAGNILSDGQTVIVESGQTDYVADGASLADGTATFQATPFAQAPSAARYAVGEGLIAWNEGDPSGQGADLVVFDPASGHKVIAFHSPINCVISIGGGWIAWATYADVRPGYESSGFWGANLADVRAAMGG